MAAAQIDVAPDVQGFEEDAPDFVNPGVFKTRLEQALIKSDRHTAPTSSNISAARCPTRSTPRSRSPRPMSRTDRPSGPPPSPARSGSRTSSIRRPKRASSPSSADLLTADDHWARAMHLMMHDRATAHRAAVQVHDAGAEVAGGRAQRRVAQCQECQDAARRSRSGDARPTRSTISRGPSAPGSSSCGTMPSPGSTRARPAIPMPPSGGTSASR